MISVDLIKQLRETTGAGIADCRIVLEEASGNLEKAVEFLKQKGLEKAAKKSEREVRSGLVFAYVHGGKVGAMVSVACETDFVAKTEEFQKLVKEIAMQVASMHPSNVEELLGQDYIRDSKQTIADLIKGTIAKLGENIKILEVSRLEI